MRRQNPAMLRDLSLLLDLTAMGMEAGLDFFLALDRATASTPSGFIRTEFQSTLQQISLGTPRLDALRSLRSRTDLRELAGTIQAVSISDSIGGNLAATLRLQADQVRRRRFAEAERRAQQIPVKLIFPLVFFIFPCVFAVLFAPILYRLMSEGIIP